MKFTHCGSVVAIRHQLRQLELIVFLPLLLIACSKNEFDVELHYVDVTSNRSLPYWRPLQIDLQSVDSVGTSITLPDSTFGKPLVGQFHLGNTGKPINFLLDKSSPAGLYYDRIFLDLNRDGSFRNEQHIIRGKGRFIRSRNRHYIEFSRVPLPYEWRVDDTYTEEPFLCRIYYYTRDAAPPASVRVLRECWRQGEFAFQKKKITVLLADDDCNGTFNANDSWAILPTDSLGQEYIARREEFRNATRLGWINGTAFELVSIAPQGNRVLLRKSDPVISKAADVVADNPYGEEPRRPRATRSIHWLSDYRTAARQARRARKNMLLLFAAKWFGPNLAMEQRTFKDAELVTLCDNLICVRLDSDTNQDIADRFNIKSYPTVLLLDHRGKELTRAVGYQPAGELTAYLRQHLKKLTRQ